MLPTSVFLGLEPSEQHLVRFNVGEEDVSERSLDCLIVWKQREFWSKGRNDSVESTEVFYD